jgi:hypothetical protein
VKTLEVQAVHKTGKRSKCTQDALHNVCSSANTTLVRWPRETAGLIITPFDHSPPVAPMKNVILSFNQYFLVFRLGTVI